MSGSVSKRKEGESIVVSCDIGEILIHVLKIKGKTVSLRIVADRETFDIERNDEKAVVA